MSGRKKVSDNCIESFKKPRIWLIDPIWPAMLISDVECVAVGTV